MASGCAIVTTSFGAEGIGCKHGKEVIISNNPDTFAREILTLLKIPSAREFLGKNARKFTMKRFSRKSIANVWCQLPLS